MDGRHTKQPRGPRRFICGANSIRGATACAASLPREDTPNCVRIEPADRSELCDSLCCSLQKSIGSVAQAEAWKQALQRQWNPCILLQGSVGVAQLPEFPRLRGGKVRRKRASRGDAEDSEKKVSRGRRREDGGGGCKQALHPLIQAARSSILSPIFPIRAFASPRLSPGRLNCSASENNGFHCRNRSIR